MTDIITRSNYEGKQDEKDKEIKDLFQIGKKRKKNEKNPAEIPLSVMNVMIEFKVAAQEDADLNRQGKPAIKKLKKLYFSTNVLLEKQQEFLDHGLLTVLKNWLEPLPDGSLPNLTLRTKILKILNDIDLEHHDRRKHLKNSGIGNAVMFLSQSDEEIIANRKLANELIYKWCRSLYHNKNTTSFKRSEIRTQVKNGLSIQQRINTKWQKLKTSRKEQFQHARLRINNT
ncbi:protein IWS1 homolog 1-like [Vigna angularis]|uniref:protein IWS1 homolog 1-like n=1 Tax=Phaseolus angularis TaxID=3914 RepID=UPI00080A5A53|nr:protein IWS1 homolog 1-like [Vigna angularis]